MASSRDIKKRIKGVKNTVQITKAIGAVSTVKMRKSQTAALAARPYAMRAFELLQNLLARSPQKPTFFEDREVKKSLLLVVTSDKGLAGAFNANVLKKAEMWIEKERAVNRPVALVTVGKKAKEYFEKKYANLVVKSFTNFGDFTTLAQTLPVAKIVTEGFGNASWDAVYAVYTNFKSTFKQEVVVRKVLPIHEEGIRELISGILPEQGKFKDAKVDFMSGISHYQYEYKIEPPPENILNTLVSDLVSMYIHHLILESNASEHSARMVAMKNASDNAKELLQGLNLSYNKARQAAITLELSEIISGAEALHNN